MRMLLQMLEFYRRIGFYCSNSLSDQEVALNKAGLIDAVATTSGLSKREAEAALDAVTYVVTSTVRGGEAVRIIGFGSFRPRDRRARKGRNPRTGASVQIKASKGVSFAAGATLKRQLNARGAPPKPTAVSRPAVRTAAAAPAAPARRRAAPAATKTVARKAAPAKKAPAKKAPAKKAAKAPAKKATKSTKKR
jgi:DNA-binding protein HU-beta